METTRTQTKVYDAIVIGARCAGSPTAMLLAQQGYQVLLLERATFPSEVPRGPMIQASGVALLKEWGLFERVLASNCPPISRLVFDLGPLVLAGMPQAATLIAPRHGILESILADAAGAAGVELREGFLVQEILMDGERVTGIHGHGPDGGQVTERAHIVIGADGLYSLVAQAVQAPPSHAKPPLTCAYCTSSSGLPVEDTAISVRDTRMLVVFPTNDEHTCIGLQFPREELAAFRTAIAGNFLHVVGLVPELAARVRNARQPQRFLGVTASPHFFRTSSGPGWALVGDAGYHKDPSTAQGITDAFFSATLLAEAIDAGFSGRRVLEEALAAYEQHRNAPVLPSYEFTSQLATFEPPSRAMQPLVAALSGNQVETNTFFGAISGTVPMREFFAPANLQRITSEHGMLLPACEERVPERHTQEHQVCPMGQGGTQA